MPDNPDLPGNIGTIIQAHAKQYLEDPEAAHHWDTSVIGGSGTVPTLLLTTKGRKTGKERHAPLLCVEDDGGYLTIGSKGGAPNHPVWFLNLRDTPDCEVRVGAARSKARARILEGKERERAWKKGTDKHPVFQSYQNRTERQIPVIRLEPLTV